MSGGYFDYQQYQIGRIADEVEQLILSNEDTELNEWGEPSGRHYDEAVIQEFKKGLAHIRIAAIYAQRIDWLVSGDDGPESFLERLRQELTDYFDKVESYER